MQEIEQKKEQSAEDIRDKLVKQMKGTGWDTELGYWWYDDAFLQVIKTLMEYVKDGYRWIPGSKNMFRFLRECPYNKIKAVIITDVYSPFKEYNTGIPMSLDPVLRDEVMVIPKASLATENMQESMGIPPEERDYNLVKLCKQGLFIVPTIITARIGGHHHGKLWKDTIYRLIEAINKLGDVPVILIGKDVEQYRDYLATSQIRYIESVKWVDKTWTEWVDQILQEQGKKTIKWK